MKPGLFYFGSPAMADERNVKMKALRSFGNNEHEGLISRGQTFFTTEKRARALSNSHPQLAQRFPKTDLGSGIPETSDQGEKIDMGDGGPLDPFPAHIDPAAAQDHSDQTADQTGGGSNSSSSSPEGQAPRPVTLSDPGRTPSHKNKGKRRG